MDVWIKFTFQINKIKTQNISASLPTTYKGMCFIIYCLKMSGETKYFNFS